MLLVVKQLVLHRLGSDKKNCCLGEVITVTRLGIGKTRSTVVARWTVCEVGHPTAGLSSSVAAWCLGNCFRRNLHLTFAASNERSCRGGGWKKRLRLH